MFSFSLNYNIISLTYWFDRAINYIRISIIYNSWCLIFQGWLLDKLIIIRALLWNTKMDITSWKSNIGSQFLLGDINWKHKKMHLSQFLYNPRFDPFCNAAHSVNHPYKRVRLLAIFGSHLTVLYYRAHQYEHFEEKKYVHSPPYLPRYDLLNITYSELIWKYSFE